MQDVFDVPPSLPSLTDLTSITRRGARCRTDVALHPTHGSKEVVKRFLGFALGKPNFTDEGKVGFGLSKPT